MAGWEPDAWRYLAYRVSGDGAMTLLDPDVPLSAPEMTTVLSGPDALRANITPFVPRLQGLFVPWSTAIFAEYQGTILGGYLLDDVDSTGPDLSLSGVGFSGYLSGMPHTGDYSVIQADPLQIARDMWSHVQSQPGGNIGMVVDGTTSPIRVGTKLVQNDFTTGAGEDVSFESGPYQLGWWKTDDLSQDFNNLAGSTPFDYTESHAWAGNAITHRLILGYPRLGRRRADLRFRLGENLAVIPAVGLPGADYASQVLMLGAGEGRAMLRTVADGNRAIDLAADPFGTGGAKVTRLRRVATVADKSLDSLRKVNAAASAEAAWRTGGEDVTQVVVRDHPNARLGSWAVGDEVQVTGGQDWSGDISLWVRILSSTISPETSDAATLTVSRVERIAR